MIDKNRALDVIEFIQMLRHTGDFYGEPFLLLDWQYEVIWNVYGAVNERGRRQYRQAYLEIPKKNGKTELVAALSLYHLICDPPGGEIYCCAAERFQAGKAYMAAKQMIDQDAALQEMVRVTDSQKEIHNKATGTFIKVLSAEAYCLHPDTLIEMADGSRRAVSSVSVGDTIVGWKKQEPVFVQVLSVEKQAPAPLYKISTHRGREITVTGEHRFLAMKPGRRTQDLTHEYHWATAKDLNIGDRVKVAFGWPETTGCSNSDEFWAMGAWAGDGECGRFRFINIDGNVIADMRKFMESIGSGLRSEYSTRQKQKGQTDGPCHEHHVTGRGKRRKSPGREWVREHFGQKARSHNKRIPQAVFKGGPVAWAAFLAGWLDTDGHIPTNIPSANWSSNSGEMLKDGQALLARMGINATISCGSLKVAGLRQLKTLAREMAPHMRCAYKKDMLFEKCREPRVTNFRAHVADRVTNIEILPPAETISLEVSDAETHITNGIVTHNSKHGLNPSIIIFDELHAQPNRNLWDVMTFGSGSARKEPLHWVITTAGDDPDRASIGWERHEYARKVINGEIVDPALYAKIYGADEDDDIYDEAVWYKANPSLGRSPDIETIRQEALQARNSEGMEKLFRWLRLNQWVSLKTLGWLPLPLWDRTVGNWGLDDLVGKYCYLGLDLSSTVDLTAAALLFPPQEGLDDWRAIFEAWIPADHMKERIRRDKVPFDHWVKSKHLHATPGDVVDYDFVKARIQALAQQYHVKYLCTDPWNSRMLTQQLAKVEIESIEVPQTIAGLSPGMKEIERLLRSGDLTHEAHPVARWCFGNISVAMDGNENLKPMKNKSADRIDVIVALINAMSIAITQEDDSFIYNIRGMRSLL